MPSASKVHMIICAFTVHRVSGRAIPCLSLFAGSAIPAQPRLWGYRRNLAGSPGLHGAASAAALMPYPHHRLMKYDVMDLEHATPREVATACAAAAQHHRCWERDPHEPCRPSACPYAALQLASSTTLSSRKAFGEGHVRL